MWGLKIGRMIEVLREGERICIIGAGPVLQCWCFFGSMWTEEKE